MAVISMKQLLEAGVHFGHQTRRWNPKMAPYIFTERNGIYIIDLQKTVKKVDEAYDFLRSVAEEGKSILFVGTKKQAQEAVKEEALKSGMFYVNERWLGGMMTNFATIRKSINRLKELEAMEEDGTFEGVVYMPCTAENNFTPELPKQHVDMIYLCSPNNPTGTTLSRDELAKWVKYAKENKSIILYDAAYSYYITEEDVPHTIYEIEGAKEVAIEFRSFSKTAGFTGTRCGYIVLPKSVKGYTKDGKEQALNPLWNRRHTTKFNGTPYIIQRGAEAVLTEEGQKQVKEMVGYYMENAKIIREGLASLGLTVFGGVNSPYVWLKVPAGMTSWDFFDKLLHEANIVGTPGSGFGPSGENYFRLTAFGSRENTLKAVERIKTQLKL